MVAKVHNPHHHPYRGAVHLGWKTLQTPVRQDPLTSWAWSDVYYNCLEGLDLFAPTVHNPSRTKPTDSRIHH